MMAGADYLDCERCDERVLYDGDFSLRDSVGDISVLCGICGLTHYLEGLKERPNGPDSIQRTMKD